MNFWGWRRQTEPPVADTNTPQMRALERDRAEARAIQRRTQELADQMARVFGEHPDGQDRTGWTIDLTRDYVDATVFGDTTVRYLPADAHYVVRDTTGNIVTDGTLHADQVAGTIPVFNWSELLAQQVERREKMEGALKRSEELLRRYITKGQWKDLQKHSAMTVQGKGGIVYSIDRTGSVETISPRRGSFCIYPVDNAMPKWDKVLTMKLWIENREEEFLAAANWSDHNLGAGIGLQKLNVHGESTARPPGGFRQDRTFDRYGTYLTP
jgi:hypothetical protein